MLYLLLMLCVLVPLGWGFLALYRVIRRSDAYDVWGAIVD